MPGSRRAAMAVEADRLLAERRSRLALEVREMRKRRGWTQAQLAARAGLGRNVVARLESTPTRVDLDVLQRIALVFGRTLTVTFGRDPLQDVADAGHLAMQELVLRLARAAGYRTGVELPTRPAEPWRSIDVALRDDANRRLLIVECWNTFGDVGVAARSSDRKRADAGQLCAAWWGTEAHVVGLVWVVRESARNRGLVARYPEVFAARFPGSSARWVAALSMGTAPPPEPGLVWTDVRAQRLIAWRRPAAGR